LTLLILFAGALVFYRFSERKETLRPDETPESPASHPPGDLAHLKPPPPLPDLPKDASQVIHNPRNSLPGPITDWPQEIATLIQNPQGANDAKAIEAFRRLLEEASDEVWRQDQARLLSAWQTLNLRQDIPDLNPKILARFFQSGTLALCQSLLTFLKTAKASCESSIRARLAADLATPLTLETRPNTPPFCGWGRG
jgi:hypothetical protein